MIVMTKQIENATYDALLELEANYNEHQILNELFNYYLSTDEQVVFITSFIRNYDVPDDVFSDEDIKAIKEYARIHC
jgi:hypothetical protein